jgi:hypothetical protein
VLLLSLGGIVGCSENTTPQADSPTMAETAAPPTPSATTELVGSWHRAQTCKEMLAAFEKSGTCRVAPRLVDENTVSFPSHAVEFGYDGDLVVDYAVSGDVATFDVDLPESSDKCAHAYAWALSAFASGPWARGEVP